MGQAVTEKEQPEDPSPESTSSSKLPTPPGQPGRGTRCAQNLLRLSPWGQLSGDSSQSRPPRNASIASRVCPAPPSPTALSTPRQTLQDRASAHTGTPAPAPHPQTPPRARRDRPTAPDRASPGPGPHRPPDTYPPGQRPVPSHAQRRSRRRARSAARPGRPFRTAGPAQRRGPAGGAGAGPASRSPRAASRPLRASAPPAALPPARTAGFVSPSGTYRRPYRIAEPSRLEDTSRIILSGHAASTATVIPKPHQPAPDPDASCTPPRTTTPSPIAMPGRSNSENIFRIANPNLPCLALGPFPPVVSRQARQRAAPPHYSLLSRSLQKDEVPPEPFQS